MVKLIKKQKNHLSIAITQQTFNFTITEWKQADVLRWLLFYFNMWLHHQVDELYNRYLKKKNK